MMHKVDIKKRKKSHMHDSHMLTNSVRLAIFQERVEIEVKENRCKVYDAIPLDLKTDNARQPREMA